MNEITALLRIGLAAVKITNDNINKDEDKKQRPQVFTNNIIKAFEDKIEVIENNIKS